MTITHVEYGLEINLPGDTVVHINRRLTTLAQVDDALRDLAMTYVAALWRRVRLVGGTHDTDVFVQECAAMERDCVWPGACHREQMHKDAVSIVRQLAEAGVLTQD